MSSPGLGFSAFGFAFAALSYSGLAVYLLATGRGGLAHSRPQTLFFAAVVASAAWALGEISAQVFADRAWANAAQLLNLVRYGLWFGFLHALVQSPSSDRAAQSSQFLYGCAAASPLLAVALAAGMQLGWLGSEWSQPALAVAMAMPVCGMLMVEQLFRNVGEDSRWNAKPACLGLSCVFVFDIYLYSESLLFARFDSDLSSMRALAHALAVPFLVVAVRRGSDWILRLKVSRAAAFYSATLVLVGGYLLFISALGYYMRYFGGGWGRALQLGFVVAAMAALGALVLSGALRSRLRVFVSKHFFAYRYDYREEWLRFTAMLSSQRSPQEMGGLIVRGMAKMVECPAGSLWSRHHAQTSYTQVAHWNMPQVSASETPESSMCAILREQEWVIDLQEYRNSPRRYGTLGLPSWLLGTAEAWLVVPLLVGKDLLGFVVLARPLARAKLNWEVLDLLKTAGRQAAAYLAQMHATEALLEARKFDAFNRMSAFVVHDLKNIVTQLSLMLKNAERLHDNREFQQDMLLTVESSLEKMRRMMIQLREGAPSSGGSHGVELKPIVHRLAAMAEAQSRSLSTDSVEDLATRGHADRMERVLGHLVQNALDATSGGGTVWISVQRYSGQVMVEVGDSGTGMSEDFVRHQLFKPFVSTKQSGMGIGSYESFQYIRELGGSVSVESEPARGTLVKVLLPSFEVQRDSDLVPLNDA